MQNAGDAMVEQDTGLMARLQAYMRCLGEAVGRADRVERMQEYCSGLLMPLERKSVEPIAAVTAPDQCAAKHQSLLHFVNNSPWPDDAVLAKVREIVLPKIGPIRAWLIDDTGLPKKGRHSVGVKNQYCGQLGKNANCQVAVTLSVASDTASLPVAYRLFLPKEWADDKERRTKARVPDEITFKTKGEIALEQIDAALAAGIAPGFIGADAGYGNSTPFRTGLTERGLAYMVGVQPGISVWPPGTGPLPPAEKPKSRRGRQGTRLRRDENHQPVLAKDLAKSLPKDQWQTVTWREGTNAPLTSRFAAVRVRPASGDHKLSEPRAVEWLLIEWPEGEDEPTKFWLSTLPEEMTLQGLVEAAKIRWRIERDYQDLKQEIGLGHYEGRGWRGFHHHATLAIAAYGFLICEAGAFSPSARSTGRAGGGGCSWSGQGDSSRSGRGDRDENADGRAGKVRLNRPKAPQIPKGFRPRAAAAAA